MDGSSGRWRIKEFSRRVGVPEATLRAWEQRYGVLQPQRTSGRFRLYSPADERRIHAMQGLMAQGISAAQAAAIALAESAGGSAAKSEAAALVDALLEAMATYDAQKFDAALDAAFALGRLVAIRDVVLPTLVEVGVRWSTAAISVGHEHFATHLIERQLLQRAVGWERGVGPLALLACPPGERHTLGLVCFGLVLAEHGWRVSFLGADTPIGRVVEAGASLLPDAVVLFAHDPILFSDRAEELAGLGARHRTLLAGAAAAGGVEFAQRLGVEFAGEDLVAAAQALGGSMR